jgi:plastocyanin
MLLTTILLAAGTASAATMTVTVAANNKFQFTPNSITAQPGDMVAFNFAAQNHSIVSSNANTPCQPQRDAIFSDFQPVAAPATNGRNRGKNNRRQTASNTPTFMVPIVDDQPMYIYCSQAQHCQQGMVMVINPPNAQAVQQYANKAAKANNNVSPQGGVSGGQMLNNAAGTNPKNVLGANAGDAAKTAKAKGKGNKAGAGGAAGLLANVLGNGNNKRKDETGVLEARGKGLDIAAGIVGAIPGKGAGIASGVLSAIQGAGAGASAGAAKAKGAGAGAAAGTAKAKGAAGLLSSGLKKGNNKREGNASVLEARGKGLDIAAGIVGAIPGKGAGIASGVLSAIQGAGADTGAGAAKAKGAAGLLSTAKGKGKNA